MNPFKFLALSGAGYLALVIVFGSGGEAAPSPTVRIPQTVQIVPLTQEQKPTVKKQSCKRSQTCP
jgi:hypothetical protein